MHKRLAFAAAAALCFGATTAMAQLPAATSPVTDAVGAQLPTGTPATAATPPAASVDQETSAEAAASASASGSDVSVSTGMSVKDKTGATIGKVAGVKTGADGKQTATIEMGGDTFAVDTSSLAVANGSASVNATAAEIKQMLKK